MNRAMSHEAGHAVIALYFGFDIAGIAVANRLPYTSISDLDSPERTPEQRYISLAAGIASEYLSFGNYFAISALADADFGVTRLDQKRGSGQRSSGQRSRVR
jgi:hypothetical protein